MDGLKPPGELSFDGNVAENWRKWKRSFQNYLFAVNLVLAPAVGTPPVEPVENIAIVKRQVAVLLHCAGEEADEIFSQFEFQGGKSADVLDDVLEKFEAYCNPRKNILYEWFVFWSLSQSDGEPIDLFVKRLKTQAAKCKFDQLKDRMLLCRIVFGLSDNKLKERLLRDGDITLVGAMDIIRAAEITKQQLTKMAEGDKSSIAAVVVDKPATANKCYITNSVDKPATANKSYITNCKFCTYSHPRGRCPAYGKQCRKCGGANHFEKACNAAGPRQSVKAIETNNEKQMETLFIGMVNAPETVSKSWYETLVLSSCNDHSSVAFKIDTGAQTNAVTKEILNKLNAEMKPSNVKLKGYNNVDITNYGYVELKVKHRQEQSVQRFEVVDNGLCPILGLEASEMLGIVKRVNEVTTSDLLEKYADVFEGIGCLSGEHEISVDPTVKPVIHAPRRVPISVTDKLKSELESMEKSNIIAKVEEPTPWVNSLVCVEKRTEA
ncbi:uncharacterized protein [Watersipora subatra]|uniref:uncharacterized protein n=1 Tax=Watersipora subatra TaxID=2589382 RepID=UPI00355BFA59